MLTTALTLENYSSSGLDYLGYGVHIVVPGNTIGSNAVTASVPAEHASAIITAIHTKRPAMVITEGETSDDGVEPDYMPYIKNNLAGTRAPGATDDESDYYSPGSIWIDRTSTPHEAYRCVDATEGSAVWLNTTLEPSEVLQLLANLAPTTLSLPDKTPVNAVAASKLLTIGTNPVEGATVSIGGVTYKFRADALGAGVAATGTLTFNSELPHDEDTVILGQTAYTFKTTLTPTAGEVLIEATVTATIDNLVAAAMGGEGAGTKYATGTVGVDGVVTASKTSADTMLITYNALGFAGNQYDTAGTLTHATWGAARLSGGIDPQAANDVKTGGNVEGSIDNLVLAITAGAGAGTNYGTGTVVNPLATAVKASAATMTATNKIKGVIGNETAIAETLADGSWAADATFLTGGVNGTVGLENEICSDESYIYKCLAANTIADANWRRVSLGSAY